MKVLTRKAVAMLTALLMVFVMMPQMGAGAAFAASGTADGGAVASNSASDARDALGSSNVTAEYAAHTLNITLNQDIVLSAPVVFKQGSSDDTVVLNLNGHMLTGAAGARPGTKSAAKGKDAVQMIPGEFNLEIKGSGSVIGGKGAAYETEDHFIYGMDGGNAVTFVAGNNGGYWYPYNTVKGELEYGIKVMGGAALIGGAGADMSGDDWIYNIRNYSGPGAYTKFDSPQFVLKAGSGGAGIGQADSGIPNGASTLAYARIDVASGTVTGGAGGSLDMGTDDTPVMTHYGLMNNGDIDTYMQGADDPLEDYEDYVAASIKLKAGTGGDGIVIGPGRKYVSVDQGSIISGGMSGALDYGKSKLVNRIVNEEVCGGNGISIYGDIGLTAEDSDGAAFAGNWESKDKDSDDMGIYIAGIVKGGNTPDADAMRERTGQGGNGIMLQFDGDYINTAERDAYGRPIPLNFPESAADNPIKWGIVEVSDTGVAVGGNAGNAICGSAGDGGIGIYEPYTKSNDPTAGVSKIGTDCYLINGRIQGGNGGDSMTAIGASGLFGGGGHGFHANNYREDANLLGNGSSVGGDSGTTALRSDTDTSAEAAEGIRFYPPNYEYYNNTVEIESASGAGIQPIEVDNTGLSAKASMTSFNDYPSTSTKLKCDVSLPPGYDGDVYIHWSLKLKLQTNPEEVFDIEPSGTNNTDFNMLSDEQYKYLKNSDGYLYGYNLDIGTTGRIQNILQYNGSTASIWCYVALEDGRWAKSNVMKFTKDGWNGGGSTPEEIEAQKAAAQAVAEMIDALYDDDVSEIKLHDQEAVMAARDAYNALVDADNRYISLYIDEILMQKLTAAEQRIEDLWAANEVMQKITDIIGFLKDGELGNAQAQAEDARYAYDNLSEEQQRLVTNSDVLTAAETLLAIEDEAEFQTALEEFLAEYDLIDIAGATITVPSVTYNGSFLTPQVKVVVNGTELVEDSDYSVEYTDNQNAGTGKATVTGKGRYTGTKTATFTIGKAANTLNVKGRTAIVKYSKVKKRAQTVKADSAMKFNSKGEGAKTFIKYGGSSKLKIAKTTGKVTVKKGTRKGTYKLKVKVNAKGNSNYKASGTKKITIKIRVK